MSTIYTQVKYDIESSKVGDVNALAPYITITQIPEIMRYTYIKPISSTTEFPTDEYLLDNMVKQLGQEIAEKLKPSLKLIRSIDHMNKETKYELKLNLVLPDEKLLYEAKETMLREMVEDGYRKYEKYKSMYTIKNEDLLSTQSKLDKYLIIEQSIWCRIKFLFSV